MNKYLELFKNKSEINLRSKNINDDEVLLICEALAKNTTLKILDLRCNKISDEGAKELAKNTTLRELYLSYNNILVEGTKALAKNTTLVRLGLLTRKVSINLLNQIRINIQNNNKRQKLSILTTKIIENNNINIPNYYPKILLKY